MIQERTENIISHMLAEIHHAQATLYMQEEIPDQSYDFGIQLPYVCGINGQLQRTADTIVFQLGTISVNWKLRRNGIGRRLLQNAAAEAIAQGATLFRAQVISIEGLYTITNTIGDLAISTTPGDISVPFDPTQQLSFTDALTHLNNRGFCNVEKDISSVLAHNWNRPLINNQLCPRVFTREIFVR